MTAESRVEKLLDALLESDGTPESVCGSCPELLPQVRERWRQICRVRAEFDAVFPAIADRITAPAARSPDTSLPVIPGYEVEAVLGVGGMGVVFRARHLGLNRVVALKRVLAGAYAGPHERTRFRREAEAVAALTHPNVVQIHDVGESDGQPYFTMEYVEGGSLSRKLAATPQPPREAAELVATLAGAVQAAHACGIVHRDLKPGNVLLAADGTPKITDFGLARRVGDEAGLTGTGALLGTPSYMAPEQARGRADAAGPAADIYALGAILYELLTGRPPFVAESATETILQLTSLDPVPPSRLNRKVPRDLETICLKCLRKEPRLRYATAAALADDLRRFQRHEPVAARRPGLPGRFGKWMRRRPAIAALITTFVLFAVAVVGGAFWLAVRHAHRHAAVEGDLRELARLQADARWVEARAVLRRAEARLEGGASDLQPRLEQAEGDLALATLLDTIRLNRMTRGDLAFYRAQANEEYAKAFGDAGPGTSRSLEEVAKEIATSPISGALIAALYDWSVCAVDRAERRWLLEVARRADSVPGNWHERVLEPAVWDDRQTLEELTEAAPVASEPTSLLLALGERLRMTGGNPVPFLRRVQHEHPADFWVNLSLGNALMPDAARQAVGSFRAALAARPGAAVGYCVVGDAFRLQKDLDVAAAYYEKALRLDPTFARTRNNLALVLQDRGQMDEAIVLHQEAVGLDPDYALAHHDLGNALRAVGRINEAYVHFQEALQRDPHNAVVLNSARSLLMRLGRQEEVREEWRKALEANPPDHEAWFGYAELCLYLGLTDEYRRAAGILFERFGETDSPYIAQRVGRSCLLHPGSEDELNRAIALTERGAATLQSTPPWMYADSRFALGLSQYRRGQWASAIAIMTYEASGVMGPCPLLVAAMAQHRDGQEQAARKTLAAAVLSYDWSAARADNRDAWTCHILRREAESLILPNLPAFLNGSYVPHDNDERFALLAACRFTDRTLAAARLYADTLEADPSLADDALARHRYNAARAAALAGCGRGEDAKSLDEAERRPWREQARRWLRGELARWDEPPADAGTGDTMRQWLATWQAEPDLAGLREPAELAKLDEEERRECLALWDEVAGVIKRHADARESEVRGTPR